MLAAQVKYSSHPRHVEWVWYAGRFAHTTLGSILFDPCMELQLYLDLPCDLFFAMRGDLLILLIIHSPGGSSREYNGTEYKSELQQHVC